MSGEAIKATERMLHDAGLAPDRAALASLPLGAFVGFNRLSGGSLSGRVF